MKEADKSVKVEKEDNPYNNPEFQDALEYMKTQPSQTGEAEPVEKTDEGPTHYIDTASQV